MELHNTLVRFSKSYKGVAYEVLRTHSRRGGGKGGVIQLIFCQNCDKILEGNGGKRKRYHAGSAFGCHPLALFQPPRSMISDGHHLKPASNHYK